MLLNMDALTPAVRVEIGTSKRGDGDKSGNSLPDNIVLLTENGNFSFCVVFSKDK